MSNTTFYERAAPDYEGFATAYGWDSANGNPDQLVPYPYEIHRYVYLRFIVLFMNVLKLN